MRSKQELERRLDLMVDKYTSVDCDGKFIDCPDYLTPVWNNLVLAYYEIIYELTEEDKDV